MMPNGQVLAYLGDVVYEKRVREHYINLGYNSVQKLHLAVTHLTMAAAQVEALKVIQPDLTEEEWQFVLKGRNAKISKKPKHIDLQGYLLASGFESLLGALALQGKETRIDLLCAKVFTQLG